VGNPVFMMKNNHSINCGVPPIITNDDLNNYYSYFENEDHEQFIFVYNYQTKIGKLRGGDLGWEKDYRVVNGNAPELILNSTEKMWLQAC
jgi:hypothetical protein